MAPMAEKGEKKAADRQKVHCECHKPQADHTTRRAVLKLVTAAVVALLFMVGEVLGGYFSNSLAIMTDAAHMLSDFAGFLISLFAIWVSRRPPSRGMSYGWHRAEVMGALVSVLIIWVLSGVLFYKAVLRVINQNFEVDANIMLITACIGVFVNVFMCAMLGSDGAMPKPPGEKSKDNINVRAAFIHVIGDLVQSVGVVIAGYIIWFWPSYKLADPILTFLFCTLVLISTTNILKDALRVVMEGTPANIDYEDVKARLKGLKGVRQVHSLHIWCLTLERTAMSAHLVLDSGISGDKVLSRASQLLRDEYGFAELTLQVERHQHVMDKCDTCQEPERVGVLMGLLPKFLRSKLRSKRKKESLILEISHSNSTGYS